MALTVCICCASVAGMIALALTEHRLHPKHPSVRIFWAAPLLGALLLVLCRVLSPGEVMRGLNADSAINPIKILVLFFAMTLMSVFLDEEGFFRYLAGAVLAKAGSDQRKLFFLLYVAVSVLTVFTSNDIVVLTFTPFICYFAKHAKIDPLPYLICEFVAANTWSMALIIGNPTNIYLAASAGVGFTEYLKIMIFPTVMGGIASLGMLWLLFRKRLHTRMEPSESHEHLADKPTVTLGIVALGGCILLMVLSSYIDISMWLIAALSCLVLYFIAVTELICRHCGLSPVRHSFLRAPFDVVPFVLSMFVLVMGLNKVGVTAQLSAWLLGGAGEVFRVGIASFLAANLVNNIPMSVLFSSVVAPGGAASVPALYAAVIGSNIGAFFTPLGALAGIMWMALLRQYRVKLSFGKFILYGAAIAVPTLLATLLGLWIVL